MVVAQAVFDIFIKHWRLAEEIVKQLLTWCFSKWHWKSLNYR